MTDLYNIEFGEKKKIHVKLNFNTYLDDHVNFEVESILSENERSYYINKVKVTRENFLANISLFLRIPKEKFLWNISQRAVNEIISADPKKLFNTLCFISGTYELMEAKDNSKNKIIKSKQNIKLVEDLINRLLIQNGKENEMIDRLEFKLKVI